MPKAEAGSLEDLVANRSKVAVCKNIDQEVIQDQQHLHMNSTYWTALTKLVKYLGKTRNCKVDGTELQIRPWTQNCFTTQPKNARHATLFSAP
jgi:hypothetical protein